MGVGEDSAEGSLGPGAGGIGSEYVSVWEGRRTVCAWGLPCVGLVGCLADGAPGWPASGPLPGVRAWTRRVAFGVVDPGRRRCPGQGAFVGA